MPVFVKGHKRGKSFVKTYIRRKASFVEMGLKMAPQAHVAIAKKYTEGLKLLSSPSRQGKAFTGSNLYKRHIEGNFRPHSHYRGWR